MARVKTSWLLAGARPAGLAVVADGSILIADDVGQVILHVSYQR